MATMEYRELYAPAHFGNTYEVMGDAEAAELVGEAKWWGFNAYGDWFDAADLKSPFAGGGEWLLPQATLERKLATFAAAARAGLALDLVTTPNHVWLDQLRADLLADRAGDERIFGQLLCPSRPEGRDIILRNHAALFEAIRQRGLELASICACPYDYGGCSCDRCSPWIITFAGLVLDLLQVARRSFPGVQARLAGWWWTPQEHELFRNWVQRPDSPARGQFVSLAKHIKYGQTRPIGGAVLPPGCTDHAFVHTGYGDPAEPSDAYGPWGPVVAPVRLPQTVADLEADGVSGFMAYSEGACDDANKALLAGVASGRFATAQDVLECYAGRYYGAKGGERSDWAGWLTGWGRPFEVDVAAASRDFENLSRTATEGWRLAAWRQRVKLYQAHAEVMGRDQGDAAATRAWDAARLAAAQQYLAEQERLYRQVWKLGLVRHVLHPRFRRPAWFADYQQALGADIAHARSDGEA